MPTSEVASGSGRIDEIPDSPSAIDDFGDVPNAVADLSLVELDHRSTPPIHAHLQPRTAAKFRALHERLPAEGSVHFLTRRDSSDVGLVTVKFTSPASRP